MLGKISLGNSSRMAPAICTMTPRNKSPMPQLESIFRATLETRSTSAQISTERPRKLINVGKVILIDSLREHKMCRRKIAVFPSNCAGSREDVVLLNRKNPYNAAGEKPSGSFGQSNAFG